MKILVTGASGFVGQNVLKRLSKEEAQILATDIVPLGSIAKPEIFGSNVEFVSSDILDQQHVNDLMQGTDILIHLATSNLRTSLKNPKRNIEINVSGTINLLEAAKENKVKKIIYSSASSVYGVPQFLPVTEDHPKNPSTVYGVGKYTGEHLLRVYQELYGLDYFVLRFTNVYGPYQHPDTGGLIPMVMSKIIRGEEVTIFGDGSQTRDFVYVSDLAELINRLVSDASICNSVVNAGSGFNTSILEAAKLCGNVLGINPNFSFKPQEGGERKEFQADLSKCKSFFGSIPDTPLEEGLLMTAKWIKTIVNES